MTTTFKTPMIRTLTALTVALGLTLASTAHAQDTSNSEDRHAGLITAAALLDLGALFVSSGFNAWIVLDGERSQAISGWTGIISGGVLAAALVGVASFDDERGFDKIVFQGLAMGAGGVGLGVWALTQPLEGQGAAVVPMFQVIDGQEFAGASLVGRF